MAQCPESPQQSRHSDRKRFSPGLCLSTCGRVATTNRCGGLSFALLSTCTMGHPGGKSESQAAKVLPFNSWGQSQHSTLPRKLDNAALISVAPLGFLVTFRGESFDEADVFVAAWLKALALLTATLDTWFHSDSAGSSTYGAKLRVLQTRACPRLSVEPAKQRRFAKMIRGLVGSVARVGLGPSPEPELRTEPSTCDLLSLELGDLELALRPHHLSEGKTPYPIELTRLQRTSMQKRLGPRLTTIVQVSMCQRWWKTARLGPDQSGWVTGWCDGCSAAQESWSWSKT